MNYEGLLGIWLQIMNYILHCTTVLSVLYSYILYSSGIVIITNGINRCIYDMCGRTTLYIIWYIAVALQLCMISNHELPTKRLGLECPIIYGSGIVDIYGTTRCIWYIYSHCNYISTRSLGALWAPTSSWWPFRPAWLRPSCPLGAQAVWSYIYLSTRCIQYIYGTLI